jgi:hypothetical protein
MPSCKPQVSWLRRPIQNHDRARFATHVRIALVWCRTQRRSHCGSPIHARPAEEMDPQESICLPYVPKGICRIGRRWEPSQAPRLHYNHDKSLVVNNFPSGVLAFSHNLESK